jgi:hypothetical protein
MEGRESYFEEKCFKAVNMLLPNSKREWNGFKNILMVDTKEKIIYHGVDPVFFNADSKWFKTNMELRILFFVWADCLP